MRKRVPPATLSAPDQEWYDKLSGPLDLQNNLNEVLQFIKHLEDKYPLRDFSLYDYMPKDLNGNDALPRFYGRVGYHSANIYQTLCYTLSCWDTNPETKSKYYKKHKEFCWHEIWRIEDDFFHNTKNFMVAVNIFFFVDKLIITGVANRDIFPIAQAFNKLLETIDLFESHKRWDPKLWGKDFSCYFLEAMINDRVKNKDTYNNIIIRHPKMVRAYTDAIGYAFDDEPCLIIGETGTGKELIANCIHAFSQRKNKIFTPVNCGGFAESLFMAEIQGHQRGAFTGATDSRQGVFLRSSGGTVFLDEINSLPIHLQSALLRIIQFGEVQTLGDEGRVKETDVRVICGTNAEPLQLVRDGTLREDLYFRVAKGIVRVPPLRDLTESFEEIVDYFIYTICKDLYPKKDMKLKLKGKVIKKLKQYNWPGNLRELENVLYRALKRMEISNDNILKPSHIEDLVNREAKKDDNAKRDYGNIKYEDLLKEYLTYIHTISKGKPVKAKELTGISYSTIKRHWEEYELYHPKKRT